MWCPKCRNEYREGITKCADCGCDLVDSLDEYDKEHEAEKEAELEKERDAFYAVHPELNEENDELSQDIPGLSKPGNKPPVYHDSSEKAEDNKSSAFALLSVGFVGMVFSVLLFFNLLPFFKLAGSNRYFVCGVLGVMFLLFIVMGFVSMKSFKVLKKKADSERSIEDEIGTWCRKNLDAKKIDEALGNELSGLPEEQKYFRRAAVMKSTISAKFLGLEDGFLDHFVDEFYSQLFDSSDDSDKDET